MLLISSKLTFFYKRVFPVMWFGFLAVFFLTALMKGLAANSISNLPFLIVPVVMAIIGYQFMKRMAFDLADEVSDLGSACADPGDPAHSFAFDLYLSTDLRTMTEIWMGYTTLSRAKEQNKLFVSGDSQLESSMESWFCLSRFAKIDRMVA